MQQRERDGIALRRRVVDLGQLAARDARVRDAAVPQRGEGGEAGGVDEAAVVVQDVHVRAQRPGRLAGDEAEGFGGEGARAAEGGLEGAGEVRFEVGLAVLLGRRGGGPGISVVVSEDGTGRGDACCKAEGRERAYPRHGGEGSLPAGFESGGCEGGELRRDGEDAVEFPVRARSGYGGRDTCEDSVDGGQ